jgi:hypothetical protein
MAMWLVGVNRPEHVSLVLVERYVGGVELL